MAVKIITITLLLLSVYLCCQASAAHQDPSESRLCVHVTTFHMSAEVLEGTYPEQDAAHTSVTAVMTPTAPPLPPTSSSQTPKGRRKNSRRRLCCVAVTTLDMSAEVVGKTYDDQDAAHPCVKAVIFNTDNGKLCADPEAQWVKNLVANMMKV